MNLLISIVTGTYNRLTHLQAMIDSARQAIPTGIPYEFVIVDGGSDDGTVEWLLDQPDVRYIEGDLEGAIKAFNTGAEAAKGKYVLLANDDILFFPGSIMRAVMHLERTPACGAVAFADNRGFGEYKNKPYAAAIMGVRGLPHNVGLYAQVGLFRRWLGNKLNWWGYGEIDARTYGGDNLLSARIWELGYSVDAVEGATIHDTILEDALRQRQREYKDEGYRKLYPESPLAAKSPLVENPDLPALCTLYLPIFEDHPAQQLQKRGLREALGRIGIVWEIDYLNAEKPLELLVEALDTFKPQMVVTQIQGVNALTTQVLQVIRRKHPAAIVINWNGDYWLHGLVSREMLNLLRLVDLQLTVNAAALPVYEEADIAAAYWQVGFEPVDESALPVVVDEYDVVFLANNNHMHPLRGQIENLLMDLKRTHKINYGLFGDGWRNGSGNTLYDFAAGRAIYRRAYLAISDTIEEDNIGFVGNRLFEILAAGNAVCLQQFVPGLDELAGLQAGVHYMPWRDLDELRDLIVTHLYEHPLLDASPVRDMVMREHSFDARVQQLLQLIQTEVKDRKVGGVVSLRNRNSRRPGGVMGPATGTQYRYEPGVAFEVDYRDADLLLRSTSWEQV